MCLSLGIPRPSRYLRELRKIFFITSVRLGRKSTADHFFEEEKRALNLKSISFHQTAVGVCTLVPSVRSALLVGVRLVSFPPWVIHVLTVHGDGEEEEGYS